MVSSPPPAPAGLRRQLGRFWTWANTLSLLRLALSPLLLLALWNDWPAAVLWTLVAIVVVSDALDGQVARWTGTISGWGKLLDPLADKFAAALGGAGLVIAGRLPVWFLVVILSRDLLIMLGTALVAWRTGHIVAANPLGKITTVALAVTLLLALLDAAPALLLPCLGVSTLLLLASMAMYVAQDIARIRKHAE